MKNRLKHILKIFFKSQFIIWTSLILKSFCLLFIGSMKKTERTVIFGYISFLINKKKMNKNVKQQINLKTKKLWDVQSYYQSFVYLNIIEK